MNENASCYICGRNAVTEALRAGRPIDKLYFLRSAKGLGVLLDAARASGAVLIPCDRERLERMDTGSAHQGVVASIAAWHYADPDDIVALAHERGEAPFIVVLDGVQDEGNLGAILRSAEVTGVHGVVIPKRRSAGLSPRTAKASAGAAEHILVARVPGVPMYLRRLRELGIWVYGAAGEAPGSVYETSFPAEGLALVLGGEEDGLGRLTREQCDGLVSLPMWGKTGSLNVSCAAAVLLYEIRRTRNGCSEGGKSLV